MKHIAKYMPDTEGESGYKTVVSDHSMGAGANFAGLPLDLLQTVYQ
jgi:hypothetical protein